MRLPANLTGGTYTSPSVQLSAQLTRNWYPEVQKDGSYTLMPWFGYTSFSSDQTGSDRGMLFHRGVLYKVSGITLYSVNSSGTSTSLGTVQGSLPVVIKGFGKNILVATGEGKVYEYDTSTLSELTDADFESPTWVAVLKNFAIYGGDEDRFVVSAFSDASDITALDYARAETAADDLVRGETFGEELYLFGERTLERWFASGVGRPPFAFRDSAPVGLASRMGVAKNDQYLYWLADDRKVYRIPGVQPVQDIGLANVIENYTTVSDAIAFCSTKQGQNFFHLNFPTEDESWVYCEAVNEWVNLSRNTTSGRQLANSYAYAYGKHLVGDYSGSTIWEWDQDSYNENYNHYGLTTDNLITAPNDFSDAIWGGAATVTTNTATAPDGTTTGDTLEDNSAAALQLVTETLSLDLAATYEFSVFIKKDSTPRATRFAAIDLNFGIGGSVNEFNRIAIDTSTGEYSLISSDSTDVSGFVESFDDEWWLARVTAKNTSGSNTAWHVNILPAVGASDTWVTDVAATGSVQAWGAAVYTTPRPENTLKIERERITRPFDGKLVGAPGRDIELNRFELFGEMGAGNLNETNPKVCLQVSTNRGKTFGTERWASVGKSGEFKNEVIWNNLGRAKSFVFKIKASDNAQFAIRDAAIDFEIGI